MLSKNKIKELIENMKFSNFIKYEALEHFRKGDWDDKQVRILLNSPYLIQEYKDLLLETWQEYLIDKMIVNL